MPQLPEVFNASEEQTMEDGFQPIPPSWQIAAITNSEFKDASRGNGKFLKLAFKILEGEHKGRMIWSNLNLIHTNETTKQIAKRELASICQALDLDSVLDSEELHGKPLKIKVVIRPETTKYPASNTIKAYKSVDEVTEEEDTNPFA